MQTIKGMHDEVAEEIGIVNMGRNSEGVKEDE